MKHLTELELQSVAGGVAKAKNNAKHPNCQPGYHWEDYVYQHGGGGGGGGGVSASGGGISGSVQGGGYGSKQTFTHFTGCVKDGQHRSGIGEKPDVPAHASSS